MLSGRRLDLLDPSPLDVELSDLAHGLARVARWNGQTRGNHAFSVAQHSLLVTDIVERLKPDAPVALRLAALLHDGPEYVIGDMISPFKAVVGGTYKLVEKRLQEAIHLRFGLPAALPTDWTRCIKRADTIAAWHEAITLAGFSEKEAGQTFARPRGFDPTGLDLTPLPVADVECAFLERVRLLEQAVGSADVSAPAASGKNLR
ncbi:HD family hydrolase [Notoacmeibacter sp. MSK16QG-6]|uniref:HD family hydrolase n=1 Tax=Notoacmeibacter sp. MSK16QG-6 TaxID=2957982 RepID=UPI00209FC0FF|nr:HD family hydrolase [Notoacmeibacter sp. MSK16QG-6]MCP1198026.1 HD family hydrolase [Notoacmeibacter sp. MSK16QG-6]